MSKIDPAWYFDFTSRCVCGGKAVLREDAKQKHYRTKWVECTKCGRKGPTAFEAEEAINGWIGYVEGLRNDKNL